MKQLFYTLALGAGLVACGGPAIDKDASAKIEKELEEMMKTKFTEVESDSLGFKMEVPSYMSSTTSLDADAPFQYFNGMEEMYVVANAEPVEPAKLALEFQDAWDKTKKMDENYLAYTLGLMKDGNTEILSKSAIMPLQAKGLKGMYMQVDGKVPGIDQAISYWIATFETKKMVYKYIFWTLQSNKESKKEDILKSLSTIQIKK